MCSGSDVGEIIGNGKYLFLHGITTQTAFASNANIPMLVFVAYQMIFAIITPALITGAFADRVRFKAYMIFLTVWLLFVYFPLVHIVWGGSIFQQWRVLDFAGGIVVHASAGYAGILMLGIFGSVAVNSKGSNGLFFAKEFVAMTITAIYAFLFTYAALWTINKFISVRVSEEEIGLDEVEFGEEAYFA